MQLRKSERKQAKIKMALQGASGTGKTYSSLLLAKGLTNDNLSKVAIIDTENCSADLYSHLGNFNVLQLAPPFTPENYIKAIEMCENAGMEVIIIDSISHEWEELLDFHSSLVGNSFTNWAKVTPRQKAFMNKILQTNAHVIATMRTKQGYVLNKIEGKYVPEKVGLKSVQRDGVDYEFTLVFNIDSNHFASSSKDRTGLFVSRSQYVISEKTGLEILNWCNMATEIDEALQKNITSSISNVTPADNNINKSTIELTKEVIFRRMEDCNTVPELLALYKQYPEHQEFLQPQYVAKRSILMNLNNTQNYSDNAK